MPSVVPYTLLTFSLPARLTSSIYNTKAFCVAITGVLLPTRLVTTRPPPPLPSHTWKPTRPSQHPSLKQQAPGPSTSAPNTPSPFTAHLFILNGHRKLDASLNAGPTVKISWMRSSVHKMFLLPRA
jgi:hypothetical protein